VMTSEDSPSTTPRRTRLVMGVIVGMLILILIGAAVWRLTRRSPDQPERAPVPHIVYLAPAGASTRNLVLADLDGNARQLTDTADGIEDFAVSPDGQQIAYSLNNADGTTDIWLLDLADGTTRALTDCVRAVCADPAWKPDGTQILYQRREFNTPDRDSWVWVVDVNTVQTHLLFDDPQIRGVDPVWSPDGRRVAVFDPGVQAVRVHDFDTGTDTIIDSTAGVSGAFSPDGSKLVFPVLVHGAIGQEFYTHLDMVDFVGQSGGLVTGDRDAPIDDAFAAWSPDGTQLALARRYLDSRYTAGRQIYLLDLTSGDVTPLVVDPTYNHAGLRWDSAGRRLVFQRFALAEPDALPEVWVYDLDTGALIHVADDAFLPAWVGSITARVSA
jgi:Tol biopolymer transport system component